MFRINESTEVVQSCSEDAITIEVTPPTECPRCSHQILHRHASYTRVVYMNAQRLQLVVPRFICTSCKCTTSVLPDFVGSYQSMSWTVQEQVNTACESGLSAEEAAMSVSPPAGPISARTVHRWRRKWKALLAEMQSVFWQVVLLLQPNQNLPVGSDKPQSLYGWMRQVWQNIRMKISTTCLFEFLHRLRHSSLK